MMWTVALPPAARLVGPNSRLSACGVPLIEKPPDCDWMLQSTPAPPGSASVSSTPRAVLSPVLLIVTVKPICSPALTDALSAAFSTLIFAGATSKHSRSLSVCEPSRYSESAAGVYSARQQ